MEYKLTEEQRQGLIAYLEDAPAKHVLRAINTLIQLEPVVEKATKNDTIRAETKRKNK